VRTLLAELTRASLLAEPTPGRYTVHDLLRDYAARLANSIDDDEQRHGATSRILDHYLHTAYLADRLLDPAREPVPLASPQAGVTPEQLSLYPQAWDWFITHLPVLLAALAHLAATGPDTHTWQLAWTLTTFLERQGHWLDLVAVGEAAVDAATRRRAGPAAENRSRRNLAVAYTRLGRFDDANSQLYQALDLATGTGDLTLQAHTHAIMAFVWARRGQPAQALHHARQALHLYQATGHRAGQADTFNEVGWCHALLGEHQQALTYCRQALTLHQQLGHREGQAAAWDSLGYAHHHLGRHAQAVTCYQRALDLVQDLGARYPQAAILTHLGDTHHATGNPRAARDAWQHALTILNDLDHPDAAQVGVKLDGLTLHRT
jgi:tetratricopeptide (TPR) repeat protein